MLNTLAEFTPVATELAPVSEFTLELGIRVPSNPGKIMCHWIKINLATLSQIDGTISIDQLSHAKILNYEKYAAARDAWILTPKLEMADVSQQQFLTKLETVKSVTNFRPDLELKNLYCVEKFTTVKEGNIRYQEMSSGLVKSCIKDQIPPHVWNNKDFTIYPDCKVSASFHPRAWQSYPEVLAPIFG